MANHRIGLLHIGSSSRFADLVQVTSDAATRYLQRRMPGDTVQMDVRYADDDIGKLEDHADDLVRDAQVEVIVAAGGPQSAIAAMDATADAEPKPANRKPVVFTSVADPVGFGLVDSLAQPGRNLTGMAGQTTENDAIRLEFLHAFVAPQRPATATRVGVLLNPNRQGGRKALRPLRKAAKKLGLTLVPKRADKDGKIQAAFQSFAGATFLGAVVTADALFNNKRDVVVNAAAAAAVPTIYQWRQFVGEGGLISYGPNITEAYQVAGRYAARCCLDEKPEDMPCAVPTKFELVIKEATATALGLGVIPQQLEHDDLGLIDVIRVQ
jgi:putative ABC transport system substrate-binding protein